MKSSLVILVFYFLGCASEPTTVWREVSPQEFLKATATQQSYTFESEESFKPVNPSLLDRELEVAFRDVVFGSPPTAFRLKGRVFNPQTGSSIEDVAISLCKIDTVNGICKINDRSSTSSDGEGEFALESSLEQGDRLVFLKKGYVVRVYNIEKLMYHFASLRRLRRAT